MGKPLSATRRAVLLGIIASYVWVGTSHAGPLPEYGFEAAAQEITQLFWLADTASVCGWASEGDAAKFKQFSVRFLSAYLPDTHRKALLSLVQDDGCQAQVKRTAQETAADNCASARWKTGWIAYWDAAEAHGPEF
jgi:hypothetical protein